MWPRARTGSSNWRLRGGGPDNVTVVVADVIDYDYGQTQPILAGAVSGDDDQVAPPNTSAGRASAFNPKRNAAKRVVPQPEELPRRPPRSRRRMIIAAVLLVLVVLSGLAIGREIVRSNYYVSEHAGTVSIMRGVQGSFLGIALQEPFLLGCLNARNELSLIGAGQSRDNLDCRMLGVNDMRPSERAQVIAGLPSGTLDEAISQIEELARSSVLPVCQKPAPKTTQSPTPTPHLPGPPTPGASADPRLPGIPAPETPTTVTTPPPPPASGSPTPPPPPPPSPTPPPSPAPTVTALPPPPPEPGTNCREVA